MTILRIERIIAMGNLNRWNGWTVRPYSVLEHTVIGVELMRDSGIDQHAQLCFLMHDVHETEFCGDIPTPDKARFMGDDYTAAVEEFDTRLGAEVGLSGRWWRNPIIHDMDHAAKIAENDAIRYERLDCYPMPHQRTMAAEYRARILPGQPDALQLRRRFFGNLERLTDK